MTDAALEALSPRFDELYAAKGRPSIAPEKLLRALLLQALYSIRSERMLVEQIEYNLLFRWFVGLGMNDRAWNHAVFSKNRERLLAGEIAAEFFSCMVEQARALKLLSDEHFTVDGTLIHALASHKSFRPKDGSDEDGEGGFRGKKRSNETHSSTTDPESKPYRKGAGQEAKLAYLGHALIENRHGLAVDVELTEANGRAEREAGLEMAKRLRRKGCTTLGADKGYDTQRLRGRPTETGRDAACGAEYKRPEQPDRRANDAACRLRGKPEEAQAGGTDLRLDEDDGADQPAEAE